MTHQYPAREVYYGPVASRYDEERFSSAKGKWLDQKEKMSITRALEHVDKSCTILDLPCGTGRITEHVLSLGYRVVGADISEDMIALAASRIGKHERLAGFHRVDAEDTGLDANSYDCVTSVRLMGHLPLPAKIKIIREMARVARQFLVVTFYWGGLLRSIKWKLIRRIPMEQAPWYPVRPRDLRELFSDCRVAPLGHWRVYPLLSDGVTYLLQVPAD